MEPEAILKRLNEAQTALKGLEKDLRKPVILLNKDKLTLQKGKAAADKVLAFMKKFAPLAKLQGSKKFKSWPEEVQGGIVWIEGLIAHLMGVEADLRRCMKMAKKPPEKQAGILIKTTKEFSVGVSGLPKGVGTLIKEVKKGQAIGGPQGAMISLLPLVILLWAISVTVAKFVKSHR
tara:strand:+ start:344 stop:874 length:531 start_codon:yes stop_codon:yes gene_type:complete